MENHSEFETVVSCVFRCETVPWRSTSSQWALRVGTLSALVTEVGGGWDFALRVLHSNLRDKANKSSKQHDLEFVSVTIHK